MNTTQETTYPGYTSFEMAIRESDSEPKPLKWCFKDLAKRFQNLWEMCQISKIRISNLERENRRLRNEIQDIARAFVRLEARQ